MGRKKSNSNNKEEKVLSFYCELCGKKIKEGDEHKCSSGQKIDYIEELKRFVREENKRYNR